MSGTKSFTYFQLPNYPVYRWHFPLRVVFCRQVTAFGGCCLFRHTVTVAYIRPPGELAQTHFYNLHKHTRTNSLTRTHPATVQPHIMGHTHQIIQLFQFYFQLWPPSFKNNTNRCVCCLSLSSSDERVECMVLWQHCDSHCDNHEAG